MEMSRHTVEAKVHCISTHTIRPAAHTGSTQRLELTPWDLSLLALNGIQKGLLYHKPKHKTWLSDLRTSLSCALDHFSVLAGRFATESHPEENTTSVFIQCNNAGAEFIHATADLTVSDITGALYVPRIVHDFFPLNGSINYNGRTEPLLAVQVTELIDGVFIGCTMNHMIADGGSFWHFINSWSEVCNTGSNQVRRPPILDRWFLNETDLPVRFPAFTIEKSLRSYSMPPLQERVFHFAPNSIAKLKHKANQESTITTTNTISSLQAVLAHVWLSVTRARKSDPDQDVHYWLSIGNRTRLKPPLPEDYFGNSVNSDSAKAKVGELLNGGLGFAAGLLNQTVSSHSTANIYTAWENFVKEPKLICFDDIQHQQNILETGSSPRFNMYGNDFGWGSPIAVRSGSANKFDGKMTVFPGAVKGSMEIEACLSAEALRCMGEDVEFMEFVSISVEENGSVVA